ncbi:MAG: ATP-binding protein [Leptothrix sp. (in: Bacteria)]|nr:ATP-binding protein [Leptothrix sp. (in: b-proteobacteria)]
MWRLPVAALAWFVAGALAQGAAWGARGWVGVLALVGLGIAVAWPLRHALASRAGVQPLPPEILPRDVSCANLVQAQLEHLPVAAWSLVDGRALALTSRARRLAAPGGVRERETLLRLLRTAKASGPVLLETERGSERWQLQRQPLSLDGKAQALLVLVPLESELEQESMLAWQQLVNVLTHEIMGSLTPIKSLSQTALTLLDETARGPDELRTALTAIAERAQGLGAFVRTFRRVSQWPAPQLEAVDLRALFLRLSQAVAPAWAARGGQAQFELATPSLRLNADAAQLEQALLALLSNAEQATQGLREPRLWVGARLTRGGRLQISVRDNGPGVPAGLEHKIFLPFFSAREGGQGIGLTVVRQLVHGMGGRARHVRPIEGGAAFVLSF